MTLANKDFHELFLIPVVDQVLGLLHLVPPHHFEVFHRFDLVNELLGGVVEILRAPSGAPLPLLLLLILSLKLLGQFFVLPLPVQVQLEVFFLQHLN